MIFIKKKVNCVIMQKNGAGLHVASSRYWDNATDGTHNVAFYLMLRIAYCVKGSATYRFDSKTMYCIVNVYGLAVTFSFLCALCNRKADHNGQQI